MKPHTRLLTLALLAIALSTATGLWLVHVSVPQSMAVRAERGGTMRVGFAIEAPYAYIDAHGQVTGEAPEIFRRMAQDVGIERIDWVRLDFANLLPELHLGRIDAIAAGMFITPERQREALFTRPTAKVRAAAVVRQGENRLPLRPEQASLASAGGLRWATVHDAVENSLLQDAGVTTDRIGTVASAERGLRAVAENSADVFAISSVTAWHLVALHPEWMLEVRTIVDAPVGLPAFVFRQEDRNLRDAMDGSLLRYLGSDEHKSLVRRFGFTSDEAPPEAP